MKRCPKCNQTKDLGEFYPKKLKTGEIGLRSYCKDCGRESRCRWRAASTKDNERNKEYNRINSHIIRGNKLSKYWPGSDWKSATQIYETLMIKQGGVCAICRSTETRRHEKTGKVWDLAVDHCHKSNRVRGLLCNACNRGLGLLDDSIEGLARALDYVKKAS